MSWIESTSFRQTFLEISIHILNDLNSYKLIQVLNSNVDHIVFGLATSKTKQKNKSDPKKNVSLFVF